MGCALNPMQLLPGWLYSIFVELVHCLVLNNLKEKSVESWHLACGGRRKFYMGIQGNYQIKNEVPHLCRMSCYSKEYFLQLHNLYV